MLIRSTVAALVLLTASTAPALAVQMNSSGAMMSDNHTMGGDAAMKPMSKSEMATMAKCKKMSPAMMKKSAKCTKMMAMHPGM